MGRFLGKCKGEVGEVAAAVGVTTRARAGLAMAAATTTTSVSSLPTNKTRRISTTSYDVHELRKRRKPTVPPENSLTCRPEITTDGKDNVILVLDTKLTCSSTGEVCSDFPLSCCSSNNATNSTEVVRDRLEIIADPEVESAETSRRCFNHNRTTRREKRTGVTKSDDQDSPLRSLESKSTVQVKMPSEAEIEDFFTAAQNGIHKRFTDKYNFDIVKDVPLEGRYEWVQIKP